ncbi:transketolase [Amycolatopsis mediterranei S699]|uniref:Transketolase n=2 Tax=Amycolatopsis mediterranei TaxID=33910 RepID=A0A0H3D0Z9_AMYMU|nr:transketolase [Amycolatopsis mediterranei]ADJ44604.1 transketolase [Amycolatopsis mediterranei U32]AEK41343.1 transketolase [Amycolatopsis mediterranei S699]AFO76317.1 transketolase [Amycolatopsis mediterranei S699]AGT83446.1 transketolase [Amycolatopsis mediterranei RB]KDO07038.1 transketolase [Amycolatopsis mediterranei]
MSETATTSENNPLLRRNTPADWTDTDTRAVDTVRVLAADAVENCGSGHPGTAMSLAPLAYTLFQRVMRHDPNDQHWPGRDRFVLSAGHSSLTLYIQLFLAGYGLELEDLKQLRKWGSKTPGHPEYRHTDGVETTTGPLGQGLANGVGMAMAARRERGLLDPDAAPGESIFDHHIFVIASDGDIEEGVTSEASSIAGRQELGNLIVFYDDNKISIEDDTNIALSEDTVKRYEAYGWHTQVVEGGEDVVAIEEAIKAAKAETQRPSFIALRTVIGYPAPKKMGTGKAHGAALGAEEVAAVKKILGFDPEQSFQVEDDVLKHTRQAAERGRTAHAEWQEKYEAWAAANPERKKLGDRMATRTLPEGFADNLPKWEPDAKGIATRKASGEVLSALAEPLPELWGGSADLAESNNTTMKGADSFGPEKAATDMWQANPYGRTLHFGVREHAMGSILNGIALHGGTRPYGATFLIFSDYMRPPVRLAALMKAPVTYVWTHDSIGLGEDGPTHQPIEQLSALRAIPGLNVVRPADANETAYAWKAVLEDIHHPSGLALTRQNVPVLEGTSAEGVAKGGYVLADSDGTPDVILIATGSEVQLAVEAKKTLEADGVKARVVSMPCVEWFDAQDAAYRESVIPAAVKARVSVEAGIAQSWHRFTGDAGVNVSIEHFGASADAATLFREFGFTAEAVVEAARRSIANTKNS